MTLRALFIFSICITFASCKEDKKALTPKQEAASIGESINAYVLQNQIGISQEDIAQMRITAAATVEHRQKEGGNKAVTMIHNDLWVIEAMLKGSNVVFGETLKGGWIDFGEDLNYSYGQFDETKGGGRYFYDFDKHSLILLDNNPHIKPQEFDVLTQSELIVLSGKNVYRDNDMQAKLINRKEKPLKFPEGVKK